MEWMTGKVTLLRLIRKFERLGVPEGQAFWAQALRRHGHPLETPEEQIARIPASGPLVVVANHPHGLVDGMVLAELIGRVRTDYHILTRSLLTGVKEIGQFMIPVPFPHEEDALEKNLEMRRRAMDHLAEGGAVVVFPSGAVASARSPVRPRDRGGVEPVHRQDDPAVGRLGPADALPGAELAPLPDRQPHLGDPAPGAAAARGRARAEPAPAPVIGRVVGPETIRTWADNPRGLMAYLRERTLAL